MFHLLYYIFNLFLVFNFFEILISVFVMNQLIFVLYNGPMKKNNIDLTSGSVNKVIIKFAIPFFLASVFNELYNITNSVIVGNFISTKALSAVSACTWICNIYNFLFYGLGTGAGIVIANLYGAKDKTRLKKAIDTAVVFAIVGGILLTVISEAILPILMKACNIGADIYKDSESYLRVYLLGNSAVLTYQMCFFILRSLGDAKHPLIYLIISSLINISLGVVFVRVLKMSIVGTAIATIISQFVVDILSLRLLFRMDEINFDIHNIEFSWEYIKRICELGIPAGIQNMLIALSSLGIQSYVNQFPNEVIAGIGVAEKTASWTQMPTQALSNAVVAIVSQNIGAKRYDRVHEVIRNVIIVSCVIITVCIGVMYISAPTLVSLFDDDPIVIMHATRMVRITIFSYFSLNLSHVLNGASRAAGNVKSPMAIAIASQVIGKFLFVHIGLKIIYDVKVIYFGSAFGFTLAGIIAVVYFLTSSKVKELGLRP